MIDLLTRKSDGIEVTIWYEPNGYHSGQPANALYLEVKDQRGHEEFMVPIPPDEAMEAFNHPFTYRVPSYVPAIGDQTYGMGNPADYGDLSEHDWLGGDPS